MWTLLRMQVQAARVRVSHCTVYICGRPTAAFSTRVARASSSSAISASAVNVVDGPLHRLSALVSCPPSHTTTRLHSILKNRVALFLLLSWIIVLVLWYFILKQTVRRGSCIDVWSIFSWWGKPVTRRETVKSSLRLLFTTFEWLFDTHAMPTGRHIEWSFHNDVSAIYFDRKISFTNTLSVSSFSKSCFCRPENS